MDEDFVDKPVQTRADDGSLNYFETLLEALLFAESRKTIWKISFQAETGERVRLVKDDDTGNFVYSPIELHI